MEVVQDIPPIRSEGKPGYALPADKLNPVIANLHSLIAYKKFQRSAFQRNIHTLKRKGSLNGTTTGQNSSILDLLIGSDNKGLPLATIEHSIATKTIIELSLGLGSAALLSGLLLKKL